MPESDLGAETGDDLSVRNPAFRRFNDASEDIFTIIVCGSGERIERLLDLGLVTFLLEAKECFDMRFHCRRVTRRSTMR